MTLMIRLILIVAAILYFVSAFFYFRGKREIGYAVNFFGWILNATVVIINWIYNGYVPFVSMTQVMTFMAFVFPIVYLYVKFVKKLEFTVVFFALCSGLFLTGVSFMNQSLIWHFPPALQSPYFVPHVMCYMLSYALCAVSFCLAIYSMIMRRKGKTDELCLEKVKTADSAIYTMVLTAFPFMTLGMCLGALWANECWGNYWAWDPKETWALVTMFLYGVYFHTRRTKSLSKFNNVILILAFAALLMTFIGVGLIGPGGNHSYT